MQNFEVHKNTITNDHAPIVIMSRSDPDLDGVACAFAYAELLSYNGLNCLPWYPGEPDGEAAFALQLFQVARNGLQTPSVHLARYILVDSSDLNGIPAAIRPDWFIKVIDHRFYTCPKRLFPKATLEIEPVGAAATLIAEKFINSSTRISQASACLLYGAVHSNTLRLQGDLTTERDIAAAQWLEKTGLILPNLLQRQFEHRKNDILSNFDDLLLRERKRYNSPILGEFEVAQLEFIGAAESLTNNYEPIRKFILDSTLPTALNLVDIETSRSYFITSNAIMKDRVVQSLDNSFTNDIAVFYPAKLRKQMVLAIIGPQGPGAQINVAANILRS